MKKFYSIVKVVSNMAMSDSISVGIIVNDGSMLLSKFSEHKKRIAKRLFETNSKDVDFAVKQLERRIEEINRDSNLSRGDEFDFPKEKQTSNSKYFDYLTNYSTGLIQFSSPKPIIESHLIDIDKLFKLYVDSIEHIADNRADRDLKKIRTHVQKKLISRVEERVHTNIRIDSNIVSEVIFPFELDCIGMNGSLVGAKSLSFELTSQTVERNISNYFALISSLSYKFSKNLKDNRFYLIANEPKDVKSDTHKIWDKVFKNDLINILHPNQSDIVAERVEETNAAKFLGL